MNIIKTSYENSYNKRAARKEAFSRYNLQKIIGLGGPNVYGCVKEYESSGFKDITIYENNKKIMLLQLPQLSKIKVVYNLQDIINAPIDNNTVYDLDFCCRLSSVERYVKKFRNNFVLTVSERGMTRFASAGLFLRLRDEHFKSIIHISENCKVIESDKNKYLFKAYHDTSPMLIIHKL